MFFVQVIIGISLTCGTFGTFQDASRLDLIMDALNRGLQFMEERVTEINLDGVFGTRLVEEQLKAYLQFEPDVFKKIRSQVEEIRDRAAFISDEGQKYVKENDKDYSATVGHLMDRNKKLLWYPSRKTDPDEVVEPKPCSQAVFNEDDSDICFMQIVKPRNETADSCIVTQECEKRNTEPQQRGYVLTHQVLYWQILEMRNCIGKVSLPMQIYFCSNIMRDAEEIARAHFPLSHQDVFMEQIGLCGMWGFKDFYKLEWLDNVLHWQSPSGCFAHRSKWHCTDHLLPDTNIRVKRREKILEEGCLSHKTAVGLLAITVSLRFEAERLFKLGMNLM